MGKSRAVEAMQLKENERLALSAKLQHEEFVARMREARETAKQRGLEKATLKMRVWNTVSTSHGKLETELNRMEGEGWTLVSILPDGYNRATIVSARVTEMELPEIEDKATIDEFKEAFDVDEEAEEAARRKFEEETGGEAGPGVAEGDGASVAPDEVTPGVSSAGVEGADA